jgi:S1-C subfamily serine protease
MVASAGTVAWQIPASAPQKTPSAPRAPNLSPAAVSPQPASAPLPRFQPWFVDDERFYQQFIERLSALAEKGECLPTEQLRQQWQRGGKIAVPGLLTPTAEHLRAEEVYQRAVPAVFVLGSVYKNEEGEWTDGMYATAWALSAEGILVTNWHVFSDLHDGEVFAAADHQGRVYPLREILAGDKTTDVAILRIAARQLTPLPLSRDYAPVGSWVGVLGHPGDNFYVFTTGTVTRYSTNRNEEGQREHWMGLTAEFAGGSSGSPVLDARGAVVGMAALTLTLEDAGKSVQRRRAPNPRNTPAHFQRRFPFRLPLSLPREPLHGKFSEDKPKPPPDLPQDKSKPPDGPPPLPAVQMILKMAVPAPSIVRLVTEP